jgi:membrane protease YdiL (CAAX protease family)
MSIVLFGVVVYPLVVLFLLKETFLGILDAVFLAGLIQLLPTLALAQVAIARDVTIEKKSAYLHSGATILILGAISFFMGSRLLGVSALGLGEAFSFINLLWTVVLFLVSIGTLLAFCSVRRFLSKKENLLVHELMPTTGQEKKMFAGLSFCAGFGEEIAYRGYAMTTMIVITGSTSVGLILTSLIFGVLHSYQGLIGVIRTGILGLLMGAVFLQTGSLWPPIIAHTLIDLMAGLVLKERLLAS